MVTALSRLSVLKDGATLDAKSKSGQPITGDEAVAYNKYLEEQDKIGESESVGMGNETRQTPERSWYLICRRGWSRSFRPNDDTETASSLYRRRLEGSRGGTERGSEESDG